MNLLLPILLLLLLLSSSARRYVHFTMITGTRPSLNLLLLPREYV